MSVPERIYSNRKQAYENLSTKQKRAANQLSNYRLFSFVVGFALAVFLYLTVSSVLGILMGVLTFGFSYILHPNIARFVPNYDMQRFLQILIKRV